ncbi:MAG: hypothetical protein Q7R31_04640 [Candidatus Levybacteria bacterium]|nr:hypothetical protein [Candidatus Levybacteria bacterium]
MVILLTIAFFSTLFFFGWQMARWVLNENRIEHLIAFSGIFGIGLYVFFINIAGLFIPIQTVFYLVLIAFLLFASACSFCRQLGILGDQKSLEWGIDAWWRKILLFSALFLTLSIGFISSFRTPMDLDAIRVPTAATIAEGNFPPVEIFNPTDSLNYHYAPDLFSAATYKITGMPIYHAYSAQRVILGGALFMIGFLFIELFFQGQFFIAFGSAVMMMYLGSPVFLKVLNSIPVLYHKFILGEDVHAPFKFITDAISGKYIAPMINSISTVHWGALTFPLMIAVVYIYFFLLEDRRSMGRKIPLILAGGFLLAILALASEDNFAVLCTVIFLFPFALFLRGGVIKAKKVFITSFLLLLVAGPIALFQGGLLNAALVQQLQLSSADTADKAVLYTKNQGNTQLFKIGTPWILHDGKPVYNSRFIVEFALLLIVLIPSLIFLFKWHFDLALFLAGLLLLFFSIPLIIDSSVPIMAEQFGRLFLPIPLFGGLVIGLALTSFYQRVTRPMLKAGLLLLTFVLVAQGLWTHTVWLALGNPPRTWNPNAKFFAQAGTVEADAYDWVKNNTTIKDSFLIFRASGIDCGVSGVPNCLFILNTRRMAPIFTHYWSMGVYAELETSAPEKALLFDTLSKTCDPIILKELDYSYIYVDQNWPKGMEERCARNNKLDLVFEGSEGTKFVRIYKIKEGDKL